MTTIGLINTGAFWWKKIDRRPALRRRNRVKAIMQAVIEV